MKIFYLILILINFNAISFAQKIQLKLIGEDMHEDSILDSLNYLSVHQNLKTVNNEILISSEKLSKIGYLESQFLENLKLSDSSYLVKFKIGNKIKLVHINLNSKIPEYIKEFTTKKDTLIIPFIEIESFLNKTIQRLEEKGFAFAKLKLVNNKIQNHTLYSELQLELDTHRKINSIVVKNANSDRKKNFPEGHLTQINRKFSKVVFNKKSIDEIYNDFQKFRFVNQIKFPEVLFTKDSTKVYVYLNERKTNTFDGFIGFTNNQKNEIRLNGYLDTTLENTFRVGEKFSLYWKSDGNNQKTFASGIEIPYLFKSPIGVKATIQIFKQDSIFQNTKTAINLGYYVDYNTRIYMGYQSTESSDIQNSRNTNISDYKNFFFTNTLEYSKYDDQNLNFPTKSKISMQLGIGKRTNTKLTEYSSEVSQFYLELEAMNNFYLNPKSSINVQYHNYLLQSKNLIFNELYRFGGIRTIRGFAENTFQANFMNSIQTEYRYIVSTNLFLHTILDYCYFEEKISNIKQNLTGVGLGMGLNTENGVFKLAIANGKFKNQIIQLNNTIIHVNYTVKF